MDLTFAGNIDGVLGPGLVGCTGDYNVPAKNGAFVLLEPFPILSALKGNTVFVSFSAMFPEKYFFTPY